jgi:hypothetical protein
MNAGCSAQPEYKSYIEQHGPPFRNGHNACARKFKTSSDPNVRPGAATRAIVSQDRGAREKSREIGTVQECIAEVLTGQGRARALPALKNVVYTKSIVS